MLKKGNTSKYTQGSWIHPDLATPLAMWISPLFAIQVSKWIRELVLTGSVDLSSHQKTNEELLQLQKDYKKLTKNHNALLYKRSYHEFKKGPVFYIISLGENRHKIGIAGVKDDSDLNTRLEQHRTSAPDLKVRYLCYTPRAKLLEDNMLLRFEDKKVAMSHEVIYDVSLDVLVSSVQTLTSFCNIPISIESDDEIAKYNKHAE